MFFQTLNPLNLWKNAIFNRKLAGLPAVYNPYEARLLVDKGYAVLVRKDFTDPPSQETKEEYLRIRQENLREIEEFFREKKVQECHNIIDKIIEGKRKKCRATGVGDPDQITEESILNEVRQGVKFNPENAPNVIPTKEPFNPGSTDTRDYSESDSEQSLSF